MDKLPSDALPILNNNPIRTAGVLVEVYSIGTPGTVGLVVSNVGPEALSNEEMIRTLYSAIKRLREDQ